MLNGMTAWTSAVASKGSSRLMEFDWDPKKLRKPIPMASKEILSIMDAGEETEEQRKLRMIYQIQRVVQTCSICELGRKPCEEHDSVFDPHVFSSIVPKKWMIVGQNPGYNECLKGIPFIGEAGQFFDKQLEKNGLKREDFYITNAVHCHTLHNDVPTQAHIQACSNILGLEIGILQPKLIITLGAVAFEAFCPALRMTPNLGQICFSKKHNCKVFPIYHPSPRNMTDLTRRKKFEKDFTLLCKLIRKLEHE
jgi:DNA polymerase